MRKAVAILVFVAAPLIPAVAAGSDAVLLLVDRSASMTSSLKWTFATSAIVQALDQDAFDALDLGLLSAPSGMVTGPACIFSFPVSCDAPSVPQEAIAAAGPKSSIGAGKRRAIRDWLTANPPNGAADDGLPLYDALSASIDALQAWPGTGHRILIIVTDGGINCGQLSLRPGYSDCNGCDHEWEGPQNLITLVAQAQADAMKPIDTFVIGLPGSGSYDPTGCGAPPYHMRRALSAIAASGSPDDVPDGCDGTYTQGGGDPVTPCHFDVTTGFTIQSVADAITLARDRALANVDVADGEVATRTLYLATPRPNPAWGFTRFRFGVPRATRATLAIYDAGGRLVHRLASGPMDAGNHSVDWDLRDDSGSPVAEGVYFVRLSAEGGSRLVRLSIVR
jgi:flagellar hook capping protein FlgD